MINWEQLYTHLLETKHSLVGEKHHVVPRHDGGLDADGLVVLPHRYHVLAHYIRYRWLKQPGDSLAYKMMSGLIRNPMHDPVSKAAHSKKMQSKEHREKLQKPKSEETKNKFRQARVAYIKTLPDTRVLTTHMQTNEVKTKRTTKIKEFRANNPEVLKQWTKKRVETVKSKNKQMTCEELRVKYGRPDILNGKWKGYLILDKPQGSEIFLTITQAIKYYGVTMFTFLKYIKSGEPFKKGILQGCRVLLTKEV